MHHYNILLLCYLVHNHIIISYYIIILSNFILPDEGTRNYRTGGLKGVLEGEYDRLYLWKYVWNDFMPPLIQMSNWLIPRPIRKRNNK